MSTAALPSLTPALPGELRATSLETFRRLVDGEPHEVCRGCSLHRGVF